MSRCGLKIFKMAAMVAVYQNGAILAILEQCCPDALKRCLIPIYHLGADVV